MMGGPPALILALALLVACTAGPQGSRATPPAEEGSPSVDPAERDRVDGAVRRFLGALAGEDDAVPLGETVRGPALEDWAAWVGRGEPGSEASRSGHVAVRALRLVRIEGEVAQVQLDAVVTLQLTGPDGAALEREAAFRGPVLLIRGSAAEGEWVVADAIRDGRPMSAAITTFGDGVEGRDRGVELQVQSLYRFAWGTVANIRIINDGPRPVRVDRPRSLIQAAGRFVGATAAVPPLLEPIAPGDSAEGSIAFHAVPLQWLPERVMVHTVAGSLHAVDLPERAFLGGISQD